MSGVRISHAPPGVLTWYAVYRSTRDGSTGLRAVERAAMHGHQRWLAQLARDGVVVVSGQLVDEGFEIAVLDGLERREARALCEQDPMVAEGHYVVELVPMRLSHERSAAEPPQEHPQ
ncbi:MAG: hypothetical protein JWO60_443 [Frankiales bacterium]|nr:hypothetical protein [Frankiales bacterium]